MNLDKAIKERHSVRKFSSKKVDWRDILKAIDLARLAPTAGNIPTIKYLVVFEHEKIKKLAAACQQSFVGTSNCVIVVCTDSTQAERSYDKRGRMYTRQQAGAAIENLMLKITELGLATCWVGAFSETTVKTILDIPEDIDVEALFPVGYELDSSKQRLKPSLESSIYYNTWKNKYMEPIKKPEAE